MMAWFWRILSWFGLGTSFALKCERCDRVVEPVEGDTWADAINRHEKFFHSEEE